MMGHNISGLIASAEVAARLGPAFQAWPRVPLLRGLAFLPLDYRNLDAIVGLNAGPALAGWMYLTAPLVDCLCEESRAGPLAYVETEYFGGVGDQGGAAFRDGAVALEPIFGGQGNINRALTELGIVRASGELDAFEAVGLHEWRHQDDFWPEEDGWE